MEPDDLNYETMPFTLRDDPQNGISSWLQPPAVLMSDGSVKALDPRMTEAELRGMFLIDDGQRLSEHAVSIKDGRDRPMKTP